MTTTDVAVRSDDYDEVRTRRGVKSERRRHEVSESCIGKNPSKEASCSHADRSGWFPGRGGGSERNLMNQVFAIYHSETDETVYCWGRTATNETLRACLRVHPDESFTVSRVRMTEEEFEALPDYDGECE